MGENGGLKNSLAISAITGAILGINGMENGGK
jgi:hypothetical protein